MSNGASVVASVISRWAPAHGARVPVYEQHHDELLWYDGRCRRRRRRNRRRRRDGPAPRRRAAPVRRDGRYDRPVCTSGTAGTTGTAGRRGRHRRDGAVLPARHERRDNPGAASAVGRGAGASPRKRSRGRRDGARPPRALRSAGDRRHDRKTPPLPGHGLRAPSPRGGALRSLRPPSARRPARPPRTRGCASCSSRSSMRPVAMDVGFHAFYAIRNDEIAAPSRRCASSRCSPRPRPARFVSAPPSARPIPSPTRRSCAPSCGVTAATRASCASR